MNLLIIFIYYYLFTILKDIFEIFNFSFVNSHKNAPLISLTMKLYHVSYHVKVCCHNFLA